MAMAPTGPPSQCLSQSFFVHHTVKQALEKQRLFSFHCWKNSRPILKSLLFSFIFFYFLFRSVSVFRALPMLRARRWRTQFVAFFSFLSPHALWFNSPSFCAKRVGVRAVVVSPTRFRFLFLFFVVVLFLDFYFSFVHFSFL